MCLFVFYLQYISEDWKFAVIGNKKILPDYCNDINAVEILSLSEDHIEGRSFKDNIDQSINYKFHAVYLLPCEEEDRQFDVNLNIQSSLHAINKWFIDKTKDQKINFDKKFDENIEVTFIRVNKTMNWFTDYNSNENSNEEASEKIENIILSNNGIFNNFDKKKFIVFFEGWEKTKSLFFDICGKSRFDGKVAIFFTNGKWKKDVGNNKKMFSCTQDSLNDSGDERFGESEGTILHEMLHTLGAPAKCAKNLDPDSIFHVNDSAEDILYKVSGDMYLDYNNDDYYKHKIKNCRDLVNSNYLIKF